MKPCPGNCGSTIPVTREFCWDCCEGALILNRGTIKQLRAQQFKAENERDDALQQIKSLTRQHAAMLAKLIREKDAAEAEQQKMRQENPVSSAGKSQERQRAHIAESERDALLAEIGELRNIALPYSPTEGGLRPANFSCEPLVLWANQLVCVDWINGVCVDPVKQYRRIANLEAFMEAWDSLRAARNAKYPKGKARKSIISRLSEIVNLTRARLDKRAGGHGVET